MSNPNERPALGAETVLEITRHFRLQWEPAQQAHVLLYPEGMVKLSGSAGEILKRIDGASSIDAIVKNLEQAFPGADLRPDVLSFLETAYGQGWIRPKHAA
ncbi:MAG: pyrroloquinoline quinone biosynthesis peptide chaperone PqqD [Burkholderiales bacterium]|nr:pyrroloquinoline quinone biosynthesis peptide chaperone PqqD [Burkholderiales bacterium]MDQ3197319.1 pyrroloquinoline quinone biosynthesis peptide chaperone PqqD [Pseudomonadota bacterium]